MVAFRDSRQLPRQHFRSLLDSHYKQVLVDKWKSEVVFNQRVLFGLIQELHHLGWYDEEVWDLAIDSALNKKKINNSHYWAVLHQTLTEFEAEGHPFKGRYSEKLAKIIERHYTADRNWRYNLDAADFYSLEEMQAKREDSDLTQFKITRSEVDARIIEQAREAERRLKRLKMAKYSNDLFDEIISEMMRDKKTIMEMMAELDVDEDSIYASQTRIAKRKQATEAGKGK